MHRKIHFLLVEDEPLILQQLQSVIPSIDPRFVVVGVATNGREGLQMIHDLHPDIVVTDIQMPVMGGLDMISQAQTNGACCAFVVLTGYSEFEYARNALQLGVDDYLLKPIDPDDLTLKFIQLTNHLDKKRKLQMIAYLQGCLFPLEATQSAPCPLEVESCYLLIASVGMSVSRIGCELGGSLTFWSEDMLERLNGSVEHLDQLLHFNGRYAGEHIFALISDSPMSSWQLRSLAQELLKVLELKEPVCIIATGSVCSPEDISAQYAAAVLTRMTALPFGIGAVLSLDMPLPPLPLSLIPSALCGIIERLSRVSENQGNDSACLLSLCAFWKETQPCEAVLLRQIEYITEQLRANSRIADDLTTAELTADALCFDDIIARLGQFLQVSSTPHSARVGAKAQVHEVKRFLERHYATPINYRILYDTFGYNEKYIAELFKKELGLSPSKYLVSIRIAMAKRLLIAQPNMLQKDVAQQIGFTDPLYFSRVFRETTGISPSQFAKQFQNQPAKSEAPPC